jgi:hypothetical protein
MSKIRGFLQTYILMLLGSIHLILITRFVVDFLGTDSNQPLLNPFYVISHFFLKPFDNTFVSTQLSQNTVNYNIFFALIFYTIIGLLALKILYIAFCSEKNCIPQEITGLVFKTLELIFIGRIILDFLHAQESTMFSVINAIVSPFISILNLFIPIQSEHKIRILTAIWMIIAIFIWIIIAAIARFISKSLEKPVYIKKVHVEEEKEKEILMPEIAPPQTETVPIAPRIVQPEVQVEKNIEPLEIKPQQKKTSIITEVLSKTKLFLKETFSFRSNTTPQDIFKGQSRNKDQSFKSPLASD